MGGSKIRDPVPAKFKHVTNIKTCTYVPALKFPKKLILNRTKLTKNTPLFLFPYMGHSLKIFP